MNQLLIRFSNDLIRVNVVLRYLMIRVTIWRWSFGDLWHVLGHQICLNKNWDISLNLLILKSTKTPINNFQTLFLYLYVLFSTSPTYFLILKTPMCWNLKENILETKNAFVRTWNYSNSTKYFLYPNIVIFFTSNKTPAIKRQFC